MPTKRAFDLTVITIVAMVPVLALGRAVARRWSVEYPGQLRGLVGDAGRLVF